MLFAGTSLVMTLPAPTIAFSPIVVLARTVDPEPIDAPFLTMVRSTFQSASVCSPLSHSVCDRTLPARIEVPGAWSASSSAHRKRLRCAQLEFPMGGNQRCLGVLLCYHKRDIALGGALCDGDDIYIFLS